MCLLSINSFFLKQACKLLIKPSFTYTAFLAIKIWKITTVTERPFNLYVGEGTCMFI